jgi:glycolate oxidase iron-sulfur subunit
MQFDPHGVLQHRTTRTELITMQTKLAPEYQHTADGQEAEAILRKCVHCGFCTATCPTYQLLGDEFDGPRGRIYLIKQVLEGVEPTRDTQLHLDRCLTCRNCETTLPQRRAVRPFGRHWAQAGGRESAAPAAEQTVRWALKEGLSSPAVRTRHEAGPIGAGLVAQQLESQGARTSQCRGMAHAHP